MTDTTIKAFALNTIIRKGPNGERQEVPASVAGKPSVFLASPDEFNQLEALNAVRKATNEEIAVAKDAAERTGNPLFGAETTAKAAKAAKVPPSGAKAAKGDPAGAPEKAAASDAKKSDGASDDGKSGDGESGDDGLGDV